MRHLPNSEGWRTGTDDRLMFSRVHEPTKKVVKQRKRLPDNTCNDNLRIQKIYFESGSVAAIRWIMAHFNWRWKPAYEYLNNLRYGDK